MQFLHPEFLYFMLPPVVILFALLMTQKESQAHFFSEEVMQKLRVSANTLTLKARNALFFLMAVLLVIALADPVIKEGEIEVKAKSADIMIAIDISDSMLAQDLYPNRLRVAKQKALQFLEREKLQRIGVVAFAKNSYLVSPLSFDHSAVAFLLKNLDTTSLTEQGTNFMEMLKVLNNSVKEGEKKYLLLISDGGDQKDFSKEIAFAKQNEITVFVLATATKKGAPVKKENGEFIRYKGEIIISKLNEEIAKLATQTGGVYIKSSTDDADVKAMVQEIEQKAQKKELKSEKIEKYIPLFYYPLGLAMILLLVATSSMSKRKSVAVPPAVVFLLAGLLQSMPLEAGLLDFVELKEAKEAYEAGDYAKAQYNYSTYADTTQNSAAYYNEANALYKQKKYKKAIGRYEKAYFEDPNLEAQKLSNLGNAHAKLATIDELKKAIQAYEKSLKIKEDKQTRENLETVKKYLKQMQQKKQQQNKNNQQKKQNQKNQENKNNKENQKNNQEQNQKNKNKNNQDAQKNKQQNKENQKGSQNKEQKQNEHNAQDKKKEQQKEQSQQDQQKQQKQKAEQEKKEKGGMVKQVKMSEAEEKKWLKKLDKGQRGFLYRLNKNKHFTGDEDAKPW